MSLAPSTNTLYKSVVDLLTHLRIPSYITDQSTGSTFYIDHNLLANMAERPNDPFCVAFWCDQSRTYLLAMLTHNTDQLCLSLFGHKDTDALVAVIKVSQSPTSSSPFSPVLPREHELAASSQASTTSPPSSPQYYVDTSISPIEVVVPVIQYENLAVEANVYGLEVNTACIIRIVLK